MSEEATTDKRILLIGVDDYDAFDEANGADDHPSRLAAGVSDAYRWWNVLRTLGAPASSIEVLVGRVSGRHYVPPDDLGDLGRANAAGVNAAVGRLASYASAHPDSVCLLVFCGRGAFDTQAGARLALEDTSSVEATLPVLGLLSTFSNTAPDGRLVVIADCAFIEGTGTGGTVRLLGPSPKKEDVDGWIEGLEGNLAGPQCLVLGMGVERAGLERAEGAMSGAILRVLTAAHAAGRALELDTATARAAASLRAESDFGLTQRGEAASADQRAWWVLPQATGFHLLDLAPTPAGFAYQSPPQGTQSVVGTATGALGTEGSQLPVGTWGVHEDTDSPPSASNRLGSLTVDSGGTETFAWEDSATAWPDVFRVHPVIPGAFTPDVTDTFPARDLNLTVERTTVATNYGVVEKLDSMSSLKLYQVTRVLKAPNTDGKVELPVGYARFGHQENQGDKEADWFSEVSKHLPFGASAQVVIGVNSHLRFVKVAADPGARGSGTPLRWHST